MRRLAIAPLLLAATACGAAGSSESLRPTEVRALPPAAQPPAAEPPAAKPPVAKRPLAKPPVAKPPLAKPPAARPAGSDVDGDGRADTVRLVEAPDSLATGRWPLRVTLSKGGTVTGIVTAEPQVRPAVLGVVDADRDGDGEVFVRVGGGASTAAYTPYTLVEDGMAEVRTADGAALRLLVGGTVTHGAGFGCADVASTAGRELVVLSVASTDGESYRGTRVTYRWRDDRVEVLSRTSYSGRQGDPVVAASYEIDCDGL